MIQRASDKKSTIGLMLSGGLDSALLLVRLLEDGYRVQPFYVSTGSCWEMAERAAIELLLGELGNPNVFPRVELTMPCEDLYGPHWSITGCEVPDGTTSDEAVFLPGRNALLLLKPALWCVTHEIPTLAVATLANNPFNDATPQFCQRFKALIEAATGTQIDIVRPFANSSKAEILAHDTNFPHHLTFSCLAPEDGRHCGRCNKCAERRRALQTLVGGDSTEYAKVSLVG